MQKFRAIYIEITNVCNLNCSFCIGTKREKCFLSAEKFSVIAQKVRPYTDYIYLHVMGEPLLHPELDKMLQIAEETGLTVNITTNGTLLDKKADVLLNSKALRKVSVSLHSFEGNEKSSNLEQYLENVWDFYTKTSAYVELRLWNENGKNTLNNTIIEFFSQKLGKDIRSSGCINGCYHLDEKLFLVSAEVFDWPSISAEERKTSFCHGLKTHIGILSDGTVIPCCLDSDGVINLGNIFENELDDILSSERAKNIVFGFAKGTPSEELCRKCGYAERFTK